MVILVGWVVDGLSPLKDRTGFFGKFLIVYFSTPRIEKEEYRICMCAFGSTCLVFFGFGRNVFIESVVS